MRGGFLLMGKAYVGPKLLGTDAEYVRPNHAATNSGKYRKSVADTP
jgi:hypothetical protein